MLYRSNSEMFSLYRKLNPNTAKASGAFSFCGWDMLVRARVLPDCGPTLVNRTLAIGVRFEPAAMVTES